MFTGVPSDLIDTVWDHIKGDLEKICQRNRGRWGPKDVYEFLKNKDMQLWVYAPNELQALCLTEIVHYPKAKVCRICGVTGSKRNEWTQYMEVIEMWAKDQGCTKIEMFARKGWSKTLKDFRITQYFFEKDIA